MTISRSIGVLVLIAIVGLTIAPATSGAVVGAFADSAGADSGDDASATNGSISTFMQSSAADTESTVDSEMFEARYDAADNESRNEIVLDRTADLEEQLETLEEKRETLEKGDEIHHRGEYQAKMTQLTVEIRALERSIDGTEKRALEAGVDEERLEELRTSAKDLEGPEITEIAHRLAGPNGTLDGSSPADAGNQTQSDGNGDDAGGPPDHVDSGSSDEESDGAE